MDSPALTRLVVHLVKGWRGMLGILREATEEGVRLPEEEIERLERMQAEISHIIKRQKDHS